MILEIDAGNTRIKWRMLESNIVRDRGTILAQDEVIECWLRDVRWQSLVQKVRFCCVASKEIGERIYQQAKRWDCKVFEAKSSASVAGVRCGYTLPETLGVDRWLAVVAAYHQAKTNCVVVDVGSAITVDTVNSLGQHLGGYIVPGLEMMRRTLFQGTSGVKIAAASATDNHITPGLNTEQAVVNGSLLMTKAMIESVVAQLVKNIGVSSAEEALNKGFIKIFLTGGDGERLAAVIDLPVQYAPELVMDGLQFVIP